VIGLSTVLIILNLNEAQNINNILNRLDQGPDSAEIEINPETESPHIYHIDKYEVEAQLPLSRLTKLMSVEEGIKNVVYKDKLGILTIGVGRSLQTNGISIDELLSIVPNTDLRYIMENTMIKQQRVYINRLDVANQIFSNPLSNHDIELLLAHDLKETVNSAISILGDDVWYKIDEVRKEAIVDVLFNLGLPHFKKFVNFIDAVKCQNWEVASNELLLSNAAKTNYSRYRHIALVIDTGEEKYFYVD